MTDLGIFQLVILPIGLGLFGFLEPCSVGSTLVMLKYLEGKSAAAKLVQVGLFTLTRAMFIGLLGMVAVLVGTAFIGFQKAAWIILGTIYVLIGLLFLLRLTGKLMVSVGPNLARLSGSKGSAALGILFGLNIPACAAPLIFALLGMAAAGGADGNALAAGFISLSLFGLALSLPLGVAVMFGPARRALDWLANLSRRLPVWTGLLLIGLGLWSIGFGLFVQLGA